MFFYQMKTADNIIMGNRMITQIYEKVNRLVIHLYQWICYDC